MIAELATNFTVAPPEVVLSETGAGGVGLTTVPCRRDHFERFQRAVVLRQIVGQRAQNRLITSAESRVIRQVDALLRLRAAAGEVEQQAVAFFGELDVNIPGFAGVNTAGVAPSAVGNLGDALAQDRFGVVEHLLRHRGHQLGAELLVERLHARLGDIVGRDLALQIETDHHRLARHVDKGVEQVFSQLAALDQFNSGNANAFMANFRGPRRVAARRHGADIHHMDKGRAPSDQSAAKMNRRDQVHIRLMDRRQIGIVEQKNIVGMNAAVVFKALDDSLDREAGAGDMPAHGIPRRQAHRRWRDRATPCNRASASC